MDNKLSPDDLKEYFGSYAEMARCFDVNNAVPFIWRKKGMPLARQFEVQVMTDGLFKVDFSSNLEMLKRWQRVKNRHDLKKKIDLCE